MVRQRFIHPDLWTDPTIAKLTPTERLMFIGLFSNADDEGRLMGSPAYLRSIIFPYDDITNAEVKEMRDKIVATCKNIMVYVCDDVEYLFLTKWNKYQSPRYPKPSTLPAPPSSCDSTKKMQPCNQIDAILQPNSDMLAEKKCELVTVGMGMGMGMGTKDIYVENPPVQSPVPPPADKVPYQQILDAYNSTCLDLPKARGLGSARRRLIKARWNEHPDIEEFKALFRKVCLSPFLNGDSQGGWKANFDWLMKEQSFLRVMEGTYERNGRSPTREETAAQRNDREFREMMEAERQEGAKNVYLTG